MRLAMVAFDSFIDAQMRRLPTAKVVPVNAPSARVFRSLKSAEISALKSPKNTM